MTGLGPAAGHLQFLGALAQAAATGKSPSGPMRPEDMPDLSGVKPGDDVSRLLSRAGKKEEEDTSSPPAAAAAPAAGHGVAHPMAESASEKDTPDATE
jgi:hypothetical protein